MDTKKFRVSFQIFLTILFCFILCACQENPTEAVILEQPTQPEKTPQQLLEEYPTNDIYDAFLVDTGGEIGTVLVTVEWDAEHTTENFSALLHFKVWNPSYMDTPLQTMDANSNIFRHSYVMDFNFDGYMDFGYTYLMGNQPYYEHVWIWDETNKQFVQELEFDEISCPSFDIETKTIYGFARSSAGGTGLHTFHQWIDGKLTCMRRIDIYGIYKDNTVCMSIQDRINNELTEVYSKNYSVDSYGWLDDQINWYDLGYHGEGS